MQSSKLLGNRRKTYFGCNLYNRFYFGEVQEDVLGQCSGHKVSQHPEKKVYMSISVLFQIKQAGCLRKCLCTYSTEVSRFVLEILEKSVLLQQWFHKCVTPKMGTPNTFDHLCKFHTLSNLFQESPHAITSTCSHFNVFKPIAWVFLLI